MPCLDDAAWPMRHPVKEQLLRGEPAMGTFVAIGHPDITERLSTVGFGWLLLDSEHGPLSFGTMHATFRIVLLLPG